MIQGLPHFIEMVEGLMNDKIPDSVINNAEKMFKSKNIAKGDILVHLGDRENNIYFIVSGILRSYFIDNNGNDVTRFFISENSGCMGELLLKKEEAKYCIEALEDCKALVADADDLKKLIESDMYCMKFYIKLLESSLMYKIERENSFLLKSATERYLDLKRAYPNLEGRVSKAYIASYLGITPVSLSRIRRTIKEEV